MSTKSVMKNKIQNTKNTKNETSDSFHVNEHDTRCAPSKTFDSGSCMTLELLVKMAEAYNKTNENDKIQLNETEETLHPKKYKKFLLKKFAQIFKNRCTTQLCWAEQDFIKSMNDSEQEILLKYTWRPVGPDIGTEWLNTTHIDGVMKQYEDVHKDFAYLGTVPRDFQNYDFYVQNEKYYENLIKNGKTKFGIIYNTDKYGQNGEHWNALYADALLGQIYFFDSYGVKPNSHVVDHMKLLEKVIKKHCLEITARVNKNNVEFKHNLTPKNPVCEKPESNFNNVRHQYKGSECGVYSINFIIQMLSGGNFKQICDSKVPDDIINITRKIYFRQ